MEYRDFSVKELVLDESFRNWILGSGSEDKVFWEDWLNKNPDQKDKVKEAGYILQLIHFKKYSISDAGKEALWNRIDELMVEHATESYTIQKDVKPTFSDAAKKVHPLFGWKKLAASLTGILVLVFAYLIYNTAENHITYSTTFGETKTITLPDKSQVTLNANSELTLGDNWNQTKTREVWLEGEAFFEVRKNNANQDSGAKKFIVHAESLEVEVLGTQFNVNNRRGKTRVVLDEGKVKVNLKDVAGKTNPDEGGMTMEPGEMVEYAREQDQLSIHKVDTEIFTSWRNNQLVLKNTELGEVATTIEDYYGLKVKFKDSTLTKRKITGTLPLDNLEVLKQLISETFAVKVQLKKDQLMIEK